MDEFEAALGEYSYRAYRYAEQVVAGEIPACLYVRQAAQRHLTDLNRTDQPWAYVPARANRVCEFIERLPHVKGDWARRRENIALEDWQCFLVCVSFGYVYTDDVIDQETNEVIAVAGSRRFRVVYIEVPRKNAKSTLTAAIGLYLLSEDEEAGAEVYSCATKREQAKIVFDTARQMAQRAVLGVSVFKHNINDVLSGSKFEPLHSEGSTMDGLNVSAALNDELHAWKRRDVYDVLETATGSRSSPMIWNITTAGTNIEGVCYELRSYVIKILADTIADENVFGIIYTIDDDDDWQDEWAWRKANPNYGISVSPLDMQRLARKAAELASEQAAFQTKRLNIWCNAAHSWMNMVRWNQQADHTLRLEQFAGRDCWIGVDLASKTDLSAMAIVFRDERRDGVHYTAFVKHYLPEKAVRDSANSGHYDGWSRAGQLVITPGAMLDVDIIERDTVELGRRFNVIDLAFDPGHNSTQYGVHMLEEGFNVIEVRPLVMNFSDPMKWVEAMVKEGVFHHAGCPVLTWEVSNTVCKLDAKDNIYPRKEFEERKIDGVVALLMAMNRAMVSTDTVHSGGLVVV